MLKNILNTAGVKTLSKNEKQSIKAGGSYYVGRNCHTYCGGTCFGGHCFEH
ncbi:hypothetical protein [uncultured Aquimarina sp.]|uniref:hypothetical protein n=1 Tax=uncultured Aquimarina sp. TaxID=575652 RepID=UPI00261686F2|nr:hypothetical protein [uncultured Aquimarina sp.]